MALRLLPLLAASSLFSLNIVFKEKPADFQLYPRNASNMGTVRVRGVLLDSAVDTLSAVILRNNRAYSRTTLAPVFTGDSADFDFQLPIHAELAEYSLRFYADTQLIARADSVVAGDGFLANGQSNAWTMSSGEIYEFVRTWSTSQGKWIIAERGPAGPLHETGVWGNRIGYRINREQGVAAAVFNQAQSSMPLSVFLPGSSNYATLLRQTDSAGLRNHVKAVFFYQGEANCGGPQPADTALGYAAQFKRLYLAWKRDYPSVKNVYVVQLGDWEQVVGMSNYTRNVRDIQRNLPLTCPDVRLMTASGNTGHWGWEGYSKLGDRLYRLMARDIYGGIDTAAITPSNILRAFYSSAARDRVTLQFDQPTIFKDSLNHSLARYFALGSAYDVADSGWHDLERSRVTLRLKAPSGAARITYLTGCYYLPGDTAGTNAGRSMQYRGPFLLNSRRVGALTFHEVPIEAPRPEDTAGVITLRLTATKTTLLRFEGARLYAEATYGSGAKDTNRAVAFRSLDTFVVTVNGAGQVRGFNPGTGRLVASREGRSDTITFAVSGGLTPIVSLRFTRLSRTQRTLLSGETIPIGLVADLVEDTDTLSFCMDTIASFTSPTTLMTRNGFFAGFQPGDSTPCIAQAAGFSCTTRINIVAKPAYVKRINFQKAGAAYASIPGWEMETGAPYSAGRGFGWLSTGCVGTSFDSLEEENYFKNTMVVAPRSGYAQIGSPFRLDAPLGNYVLRVANYNNIACHGNAWIMIGNDTILMNTACTYSSHRYGADVTRDIAVTGDSGLVLKVYGAVCYLVLVSADCPDFNLVARDAVTWPPVPPSMDGESPEVSGSILGERPMACPNPFNPATTIRFHLPANLSGDYALFTVGGRRVFRAPLSPDRAGRAVVLRFNAKEAGTGAFASSVYVGRLSRSDGKRFSHRLMLVR